MGIWGCPLPGVRAVAGDLTSTSLDLQDRFDGLVVLAEQPLVVVDVSVVVVGCESVWLLSW